jgi:hypothetical protein
MSFLNLSDLLFLLGLVLFDFFLYLIHLLLKTFDMEFHLLLTLNMSSALLLQLSQSLLILSMGRRQRD